MRNSTLLSALAALVLVGTPSFAEKVPGASRLDNRVRITPYVDGQVFTIRVTLTRATTVEFEPGETIVSIVAGDTEGFNFEGVPGGRVFAIKPTARGIETNVTVYTNQRSYYFRVVEGNAAFYVLRFNYPNSRARSDTRAVRAATTTRRYGVSKRTEITPARIWDDGTFTYFQFARNAPIPAIFKVSGGRERSTNSQKMKNGVMRVSGVSRQWALRIGNTEVCIVEVSGD